MKINEHLVKIQASKAPISKELELGSEVVIGAKGIVVKIQDEDQFDGTMNRVYIVKVELAEDMSVR